MRLDRTPIFFLLIADQINTNSGPLTVGDGNDFGTFLYVDPHRGDFGYESDMERGDNC